MARLAEYDRREFTIELMEIARNFEFLESRIRVTPALEKAVENKKATERKWIAELNTGDSPTDFTTVQRIHLHAALGSGDIDEFFLSEFTDEWNSLNISRRRLEHILENGNVHILNCPRAERDYLDEIWRCVQTLPCDRIKTIVSEDYAYTDFRAQCVEVGLPDDGIRFLLDLLPSLSSLSTRPIEIDERYYRIVELRKQRMSHRAIGERLGISDGNSRQILFQNGKRLAALEAGHVR
jgi:hypothetical protein